MSKTIKVGLITHGGGAHVSAYLTALAASESCSQVALADPDGRWSAAARKTLGKKLTTVHRRADAMLQTEKPAMALITMEARLAPPLIRQALTAGCHVFAEKPACVNVNDFAPLVQLADARHLHLMLALANRTNPEIVKARKLVRDNAIGKIYGVDMHLVADQTRLTRKSYQQQWFADKKRAGGGHLIWLGIHWLDLAMQVTHSSIRKVSGFVTNVGGQPIQVEDSAVATLQFDNKSLGTMTSGYYLDRGYHSQIKIWGSQGWLQLQSMKSEPLTWYQNTGPQARRIQSWSGSKEPRGYTPFVQAAVRACADGGEPPISSADSLRALKTVFAIYSAAQTGRSVTL